MDKKYKQTEYKHRARGIHNGIRYDVKANDLITLGQRIQKAKDKIDSGEKRTVPTMKLSLWEERYRDIFKSKQLKNPNSLDKLEGIARKWILPVMGDIPVSDITSVECQQVLNNMQGLSLNYMKCCAYYMKDMFEKAMQPMGLKTNPAAGVMIPAGNDGKGRACTENEEETFLRVCNAMLKNELRLFGLYGLIMYHCGAMPIETANIQGRHINFDEYSLHIAGTKTIYRDRHVPIPLALADILKEEKRDPFEYLITRNNHPMTKQDRIYAWEQIKKQMNISLGCRTDKEGRVYPPYAVAPDFVSYCLRHTYANNLRDAEIDIATAAEFMGHGSLDMLKKVYLHAPKKKAFNTALAKINSFNSL